MYRPNALKKRLLSGGKVLGCWATLGHPHVCEILALAGYDFLLVDQEHGIGEPSMLIPILQAVSATPATVVVRVPASACRRNGSCGCAGSFSRTGQDDRTATR